METAWGETIDAVVMIRGATLVRRATFAESGCVAAISRQSRKYFLPYLPNLHTIEEDKQFFQNCVFRDCEVWVAEQGGELVGFCAFKKDWLDHLYLLPGYVGQSLGRTLLEKAKERHRHLQAWVFTQNTRAIAFYERNGFKKVLETDGSDNEEKTPDALFQWHALG